MTLGRCELGCPTFTWEELVYCLVLSTNTCFPSRDSREPEGLLALLVSAPEAWSKEMSKLPRMWEVDVTLGHCFRGSARSHLGAFRVSPFGWFGSAAWAPLSCKTRGQQCSAAGAVVRQAVNITSLLQKLSP